MQQLFKYKIYISAKYLSASRRLLANSSEWFWFDKIFQSNKSLKMQMQQLF